MWKSIALILIVSFSFGFAAKKTVVEETSIQPKLSVNGTQPKQENKEESPYEIEPGYLSNPVSRLIKGLLSTVYYLARLDNALDGKYWKMVGESVDYTLTHTLGLLGDVANDVSRAFNRIEAQWDGYEPSQGVIQCTSALPIPIVIGAIKSLTQMKHSWIQSGNQSYGMPYALDSSYFGGAAVISNPDPFVGSGEAESAVVCTPVMRPATMSNEKFQSEFKCIAEKLSVSRAAELEKFKSVTLDYHAFFNNCVSASRYLVECAEGKITQSPNFAVGTSVDWEDEVFLDTKIPEIVALENTVLGYVREVIFEISGLNSFASRPDFSFTREPQKLNRIQELLKILIPHLKALDNELEKLTDPRVKRDRLSADLGFYTSLSDYQWPLFGKRFSNTIYNLKVQIEYELGRKHKRRKLTLLEACNVIRQDCGLPSLPRIN